MVMALKSLPHHSSIICWINMLSYTLQPRLPSKDQQPLPSPSELTTMWILMALTWTATRWAAESAECTWSSTRPRSGATSPGSGRTMSGSLWTACWWRIYHPSNPAISLLVGLFNPSQPSPHPVWLQCFLKHISGLVTIVTLLMRILFKKHYMTKISFVRGLMSCSHCLLSRMTVGTIK